MSMVASLSSTVVGQLFADRTPDQSQLRGRGGGCDSRGL